VLVLLQNSTGPLTRTAIREHLKVNNQRLGDTLAKLDKQALVLKTSKGWLPLGNGLIDKRSKYPNDP
jgi:predicted transcriptional regulator